MTRCKNYNVCGQENSIICGSDYLAKGNCGTRKEQVAPLIKKDNQLEKQINVFIK